MSSDAKKWSYHPGLERIAETLVKAFKKIGPRIHKELQDEYREGADRSFKYLIGMSKDSECQGYIGVRGWYQYMHFDREAAMKEWESKRKKKDDYSDMPPNNIGFWEEMRKFAPFLKVSYYQADEDAKRSYERARESFIYKNMGKMEHVLGARKDIRDVRVKCKFRSGVFEGTLEVTLSDGFLRSELGLKYVVRRIPHVTPYFQYPLIFVEAKIGGQQYGRQSEKELRDVLAGVLKGDPA